MGNPIRILIGDDGSAFPGIFANSLRSQGFWVYTRKQTEHTILQAIQSDQADVLVLDCTLPTMDFAALIRKILQRRNLIVYVLSAASNSVLEQLVLQEGTMRVWKKPVDTDAFAAKIREDYHDNASKKQLIADSQESMVGTFLMQLGIPVKLRGFYFLQAAIRLTLNDRELLHCITTRLYPLVAEALNTTPSRVERSIRHAIEVTWERGEPRELCGLLGCIYHPSRSRPTNTELIALVTNQLHLAQLRQAQWQLEQIG